MDVAGEMQVDVGGGLDLGGATPGAAPLDAEDRPEARLPDADDRPLSQPRQTHREADADGRLSLPCLGRGDGADEDQPSPALAPFARRQIDLRFGATVRDDVAHLDAEIGGDIVNGAEHRPSMGQLVGGGSPRLGP